MSGAVQDRDELDHLAQVAENFALAIGTDDSPLSAKAHELVNRLRERRFDVAVVGEFNRGKSTLLNKLLQRMVLPSGVLPVTSIITEVTYGSDEQAKVIYQDGRDEIIDLTELDKYVSEEENPGNMRKIATAQVTLPSSVLRHGAVLVDTPGVGSIFRHNTDLAREMMLRADGAVMVMSAVSPITDAERSLIRLLSQRSQRTFFVLNRIDHLEPDELERVKWFVENVLHEACGQQQPLYCLSAKNGGDGFDKFAQAFETFLAQDLEEARLALARMDIQAIATRAENECVLQESAMLMSQTELQERVEQFRRTTDWQHEAFNDDLILFQHAVERILHDIEVRTATSSAPDESSFARVRAAVEGVPQNDLETVIDKAIEEELRAALEPIRRREEYEVEQAWRKATDRFERATQRRSDKMSEIAGDLFEVTLSPAGQVQPATQRGRFFYSAPMTSEEPQPSVVRRLLGPLLLSSGRRNRQRLLEAGDARLSNEFRVHIERLKVDLKDRVQDASRDFIRSMDGQVNEVSNAMFVALQRAESASTAAESDRDAEFDRLQSVRNAATLAQSNVE